MSSFYISFQSTIKHFHKNPQFDRSKLYWVREINSKFDFEEKFPFGVIPL